MPLQRESILLVGGIRTAPIKGIAAAVRIAVKISRCAERAPAAHSCGMCLATNAQDCHGCARGRRPPCVWFAARRLSHTWRHSRLGVRVAGSHTMEMCRPHWAVLTPLPGYARAFATPERYEIRPSSAPAPARTNSGSCGRAAGAAHEATTAAAVLDTTAPTLALSVAPRCCRPRPQARVGNRHPSPPAAPLWESRSPLRQPAYRPQSRST